MITQHLRLDLEFRGQLVEERGVRVGRGMVVFLA